MANIFSNLVAPARSVADYTADLDERDARRQALGLRAMAMQDAQQERAFKMQGAQRQQAVRNKLAELAQASGGDIERLLSSAEASGEPELIELATKQRDARAKTREVTAKAGKEEGETLAKRIDSFRAMLPYIDTPEGAARWLQGQYSDPVLGQLMAQSGPVDGAVRSIPRDPQQFGRWREAAGMGMEKFAEIQRKREEGAQKARNDLIGPDGKVNAPLLDAKKATAAAGRSSISVGYGAPMSGVDDAGNPVFFSPPKDPTKGAPVVLSGVKPAPHPLSAGMQEKVAQNTVTLQKIDAALSAMGKRPDSLGAQNYMGDPIMQRVDPGGVEVRAMLADIAGQKIHDRSGAAVTVGEAERLKPYIPAATDNPAAAMKKMQLFRKEYAAMQQAIMSGAKIGQATAKAEPAAEDAGWSIKPAGQ